MYQISQVYSSEKVKYTTKTSCMNTHNVYKIKYKWHVHACVCELKTKHKLMYEHKLIYSKYNMINKRKYNIIHTESTIYIEHEKMYKIFHILLNVITILFVEFNLISMPINAEIPIQMVLFKHNFKKNLIIFRIFSYKKKYGSMKNV